MPFNFRAYITYFYYSFFKANHTPARLSLKRFLLLVFLFFVYPLYNLYIRIGYYLDDLLYSSYRETTSPAPVFIIGNFRSGTTFFHRLMLKDPNFTSLKTWEIFFAPAITQRKLIRGIIKISRFIGSPIRRLSLLFDRSINEYSYMHKTGLRRTEEDSHLLYHIWSSYNLFALFPFPELAKKYIYYDQEVPADQRRREFTFYQDVLRRHMYLNHGKCYVSKNPDFSPSVETLKEFFPEAKFINIVREPEEMVPSTINMWANHWHTFGDPEENYPLTDVLMEHTKHWYVYPHQRLSKLPPDRYAVVKYADFVYNPQETIERIYRQFGFAVTSEYQRVLQWETERSRRYKGKKSYPLQDMGLDKESLKRDYAQFVAAYKIRDHQLKAFAAEG
jgi:omega-hydroxy-beta-dihydromenaquinone-9 sulfotransferase